MTNFWRRLTYYGFGFLIGMLFLVFFFQNRGCSWLPSNRVKNAVLDRLVVVSESTEAQLLKKGITLEDVVQVLNDGEVDFSKSKKDGDDKVYYIEKDGETYLFSLPYESFISEVHLGKNAKSVKTSTEGFGKILRFPNDDNLVYPDSTKLVTCQQQELGLIAPKEIFAMIKSSGKIDFGKCDLSKRPKPEQYIWFTDKKGRTIGVQAIWYKNKINITRFDTEEGMVECNEDL